MLKSRIWELARLYFEDMMLLLTEADERRDDGDGRRSLAPSLLLAQALHLGVHTAAGMDGTDAGHA
jgi:hypothetical protein